MNNTLLNNEEVTEEIRKELKRFLETNNSENTMTQSLWNSAKSVLRGKFIAIQSYLNKQGKHRIENLMLHLNMWKKKKKRTPKSE